MTHLSTAETIAAVPAPNTSNNDPFFSASTKSPIVIFLSDTLRLEGRPGIDFPSICPRHRFNTLHVSSIPDSDLDDVPISSDTWENEISERCSDELNTSFWGLEGNEQVHRTDLCISFGDTLRLGKLTSVKV
jgi:hypothetical protein